MYIIVDDRNIVTGGYASSFDREGVTTAGIDPIESEFIDKFQDDGFGREIITGDRKRDPSRCAFRLSQLQQVLSMNIIERLNY